MIAICAYVCACLASYLTGYNHGKINGFDSGINGRWEDMK